MEAEGRIREVVLAHSTSERALRGEPEVALTGIPSRFDTCV